MKFQMKTVALGFEVPFFDQENQDGLGDLAENITSRYRDWFDVLKFELDILELPSTNHLILVTLVIRINTDMNDLDQIDSDLVKLREEVTQDIEDFLKERDLNYKIYG